MLGNASSNVLVRFYRWWLRELAQVLAFRKPDASAWGTLLKSTSGGLEIATRSGRSVKVVGTLPPDSAPEQVLALRSRVAKAGAQKSGQVRLRLSPDHVIERTIQIPEAASDVIAPVLQNQLERIVPWSQDDTRYGYRIVGPNEKSPDQLDIQVVATTRNMVEKEVSRAQSIGVQPDVVDYAPDAEALRTIELLSLAPDPVKRMEKRLHGLFAFVLSGVLVVSAFGLYHMSERQAQNDELEAKISVAMARVEEVKQLNDQNTQLREQRERLVRRKVEEPVVMVLIEALSRALPDTAYLTELEIHGRDTRIVGKSGDPTALITMLEATPQFEDVHFSAATTREEGETAGTFSIIGRARGGANLEGRP